MARRACELTTKVIKNKNKNKIRTPSHDRYPTSLKKSIGTSRGVCLSREEPTTAAHDADAEPVEAEEETCRLQEGTWKRARGARHLHGGWGVTQYNMQSDRSTFGMVWRARIIPRVCPAHRG